MSDRAREDPPLLRVPAGSDLPEPMVLPRAVSSLGAAHRRLRVLMLSDHFVLPYRVMRCLAAAGAEVHVLGGPGSRGLRLSRFCASYEGLRGARVTDCERMRDDINGAIAARAIDLVVAGDHTSMRPLIRLETSLCAPCFPMPTLDQFDLLNNKARFTAFCEGLGVRCPRSELVADRAALARRLSAPDMRLPCVAKAIDMDGSRGLVVIRDAGDTAALEAIDYEPILLQEYVEGTDVVASVYCESGNVEAFVAHYIKRATYATFASTEIEETVGLIAQALGVTGLLNFDMRLRPDGAIFWLECNPRFFYSMAYSMLAGIDFAAFGLPGRRCGLRRNLPAGTAVRTFKSILATLPRPWRLTRRDWAYAGYIAADPIVLLYEWLGLERPGRES